MGLLDQVMSGVGAGRSQPAQRPGLGSTVAAGVVLALLVKGVRQYMASHPGAEDRSFEPRGEGQAATPKSGQGGGMLGGLGSLLGGLGGAGALDALVRQMRQKGYGQQVDSWVGHGPNAPIAPHQLADALGEDTVGELQKQTGMDREALLGDLSRTLPDAVHEVTPEGRIPDEQELHKVAQAAPPPR